MTALIRVVNLWCCDCQRVIEIVQTEQFLECVRESPRDDISAVPIYERHKVAKAIAQSYIGDVGSPDLIGAGDR